MAGDAAGDTAGDLGADGARGSAGGPAGLPGDSLRASDPLRAAKHDAAPFAHDHDHVWYACYGSNMNRERFLCYLRGGTPAGATHEHPACEDNSEPTHSQPIQLPYPMCFAHKATNWQGGGACFLALPEAIRTGGLRRERGSNGGGGEVYPGGHPATRRTLARMYRITRRQFACVLRGENALSGARVRPEDLGESLHATGVADLGGGAVYHLCLHLGVNPRSGNEPIYTFTGSPASVAARINPPSEPYLRTVIAGLLETYGEHLSDLELAAYLTDALCTGIDPAHEHRGDPDLDVLGLIGQVRAKAGPPAPVGHYAVVERTTIRSRSRRESIAWLRRHPSLPGAQPLGLERRDLFVTSRTVVDRVHLDLHADGSARRYLYVPASPLGQDAWDGDGQAEQDACAAADAGGPPADAEGTIARLRVPAVLLGERPIDTNAPPPAPPAAPGRLAQGGRGGRGGRSPRSPATEAPSPGRPTLRGRPVEAHALELDEKIRVGLGVNLGDVVGFAPELRARPEYAARQRPRWGRGWGAGRKNGRKTGRPNGDGVGTLGRLADLLSGLLEFAVGSQPELMRVDFATPVDMEVNLCRMAREVFDVIGVNPGDHVKVVGADGKRVGLRAVEMTDAQAARRRTQQDRMPQWFQAHLLRSDMRRVRRMSADSELPTIYLDLEARGLLGIDTGEVVRVVRDPLRNLGLRIYLVVVPAAFFIGRGMASAWGPLWGTLAAVGVFVAATVFVLGLELRLRITR